MTTKEIFALRLCEARENKGLTRQRVADDLGISRASLEYYEKGKRTPDINTINVIADYFGISIDYLFGKTECTSRNESLKMVCDYTGLDEVIVGFFNKEKTTYGSDLQEDEYARLTQQLKKLNAAATIVEGRMLAAKFTRYAIAFGGSIPLTRINEIIEESVKAVAETTKSVQDIVENDVYEALDNTLDEVFDNYEEKRKGFEETEEKVEEQLKSASYDEGGANNGNDTEEE